MLNVLFAIQSSSLNDDVDDMSSSESLCPGGGGAPSGAGASGFLKKAYQKNMIYPNKRGSSIKTITH